MGKQYKDFACVLTPHGNKNMVRTHNKHSTYYYPPKPYI